MCGVEVLREFVGCQRAAQMITAPCCHMDGSTDFFILNVTA